MSKLLMVIIASVLCACGSTVTKVIKEPVEVKTVVYQQCEVKRIDMVSVELPEDNILSLANACIAKNLAYQQYIEEFSAAASKCIKFVE